MLTTKRLGWQKYEDVIEDQINSPLIGVITKAIEKNNVLDQYVDKTGEVDIPYDDGDSPTQKIVFGIPDDISNEIALIANFDCWIGHSNFNITDEIKNELCKMRGVEVLKVCGRYRFFIGVGKMFKFTDVRQMIEDQLLE